MKKSLIAVGVVGLLGFTSAAVAAEFDWNGSIRAGYTSSDQTTIGANVGSRIGVKASTDLGNGQSAGAELSYSIGVDNIKIGGTKSELNKGILTVRRQNVWLSGSWGKLTLGQHGGIYRSAANWDQAAYLGGNVRFDGDGGGATGIVYSSNISGPFSFDFTAASAAGKTIGQWATTAHYDFGVATANFGYHVNTGTPTEAGKVYKSNTALSVDGSAGGFGYVVAYEVSKDAWAAAPQDANTIGLYLSYDSGDNRVYLEYEAAKVKSANGPKATLVGYRRDLGAGVDFTAEYVTVKPASSKNLNLVLKYNF